MIGPKTQTLPSTMEETQTQMPTRENRLVDISESFSKEALKTIEEASYFAQNKKNREITPFHLLAILLKNPKIGAILKEKKITIDNNQFTSQSLGKNIAGQIVFSPDLIKVLFGSYFLAKQEGLLEVNDYHLFSALAVYPTTAPMLGDAPTENISTKTNFIMPETLGKYATDKTTNLQKEEENFVDRESELEQMLRILVRESKHNIILIGEPGAGKSSLAIGLSKMLKTKNIASLSASRIISLDLGSLFSTPNSVSFFAPKIIEEFTALPKTIIFLEQITLLQGTQQFSLLINFLQGLEKSGQVSFVLPVTVTFYNQFLVANPYFSSFFEVVKIEELSPEITAKLLEKQAVRMEKYHNVSIEKEAFLEIAMLAKRYLQGNLPQKAISLLEETCASSSLAKNSKVTLDDIKKVVAQKTGIPINSLTLSEKEKLKNLENVLQEYVINQEEAIRKVSESLRRARAGLKDPKKPIGSFLFLGPTGVGKTELAKTLAKIFFDDEKAFIRLDMSEYSESHTAQRLIGSPPGYVGYEEGGQLTNPVMERPYSLILLDEIEKAHPRVFDLFLQVLDDGRLTDSQGKTVDFKNTLLIFTSNLAAEQIFTYGDKLIDPNFDRKAFLEKIIMPEVRQYFRPEFINRFDDIVLFNPLTKEGLLKIARIKIRQLEERLAEKKIKLDISDETLTKIVEGSYNPAFGARPLERALREQIENMIAKKLIAGEIKEGETYKL